MVLAELELPILIIAQVLTERFLCNTGLEGALDFEKLTLIAIFMAQKIHNENEIWTIQGFKDVVDLKAEEIAEMERLFMQGLGFKLHVSKEEFEFYSQDLEESIKDMHKISKDTASEAANSGSKRLINFS